jgi:hypothetical protein
MLCIGRARRRVQGKKETGNGGRARYTHSIRRVTHLARESITSPRDHELRRDGGQPIVVREEETRGERVRDAVDAWEEQQNSGRPRTGLPRGVGVGAGAG